MYGKIIYFMISGGIWEQTWCLWNNRLISDRPRTSTSLSNVTVEARVRSQASSCGICGGQCGTWGTFFSEGTSLFICQYHSTRAMYSCFVHFNRRYINFTSDSVSLLFLLNLFRRKGDNDSFVNHKYRASP